MARPKETPLTEEQKEKLRERTTREKNEIKLEVYNG